MAVSYWNDIPLIHYNIRFIQIILNSYVTSGPLTFQCITTITFKIGSYNRQWFAAGQRFSPGTPVSSTNKTFLHDITEILLKVALNTKSPKPLKILKSRNMIPMKRINLPYIIKTVKDTSTCIHITICQSIWPCTVCYPISTQSCRSLHSIQSLSTPKK